MTSLPFTGISAPSNPFASPRATRRFYVGIAVAALAVVFSGFAPSFYLRSEAASRLPLRAILHGSLFSAWVILFAAQIGLVAAGQVRVHRRLGVSGAVLAAAMIVSAPPMALAAARRGAFTVELLLVMLVDLLLFGVFVGAGIYNRRRPETHKRLIVLGMISMLAPAISRWPIATEHAAVIPVVLVLFLVATPLFDYFAGRRPNAVSLWGGVAIVVSEPLRFAIAHTAAWHAFANWLIR